MQFRKIEKPAVQETPKENLVLEGRSLSTDEIIRILQAQAEVNREATIEAVRILASEIVHPSPTDEQLANRQKMLEHRIEEAQERDAIRAHKRKHCQSPADPNLPHRRPQDHGQFSGKSVIAWHLTTLTEKGPAGSRDGAQVAFGFCQWCGTEWKPDDPDYAEALNWGVPRAYGSYPMNRSSGHWS